jgi:hypothetical protein
MSSLALSSEMLAVKSYLSDARVLLDEQFGKGTFDCQYTKNVIEVARMLQAERANFKKGHPKSAPEKEKPTNPKQASSDKLMSSVRANPKLPPLVSTEPQTEVVPATQPPRSSVNSKARPSRSRKTSRR